MHPCPLDVLHDARHQHVGTVADRVDLDLGAFEVLVDQQRLLARDLLGHGGVGLELRRAAANLHRPTAEHKRGSYQNGITELLGKDNGLLGRGHDPARRLRNTEMIEQVAEQVAVLGHVDRPQVRAEQRVARVHQRLGQVDRRLAAELRQHRRRMPIERGFVLEHVADRLVVQRLEVQPTGGIEIRADRLGVGVDHDALDAVLA